LSRSILFIRFYVKAAIFAYLHSLTLTLTLTPSRQCTYSQTGPSKSFTRLVKEMRPIHSYLFSVCMAIPLSSYSPYIDWWHFYKLYLFYNDYETSYTTYINHAR